MVVSSIRGKHREGRPPSLITVTPARFSWTTKLAFVSSSSEEYFANADLMMNMPDLAKSVKFQTMAKDSKGWACSVPLSVNKVHQQSLCLQIDPITILQISGSR